MSSEAKPVTSVLWEKNRKRALFHYACWVVIFRKFRHIPVINVIGVPRLVLFVLYTGKWLS